MVLLGYDSTRAYKLYDPNKDNVVVSRDILVDESKDRSASSSSVASQDRPASSISSANRAVVVELDEGQQVSQLLNL